MDFNSRIKKIFTTLIEALFGLLFFLGVLYLISSTDWWAEKRDEWNKHGVDLEARKDRDEARRLAASLGPEGLELQNKLSLLILERNTTTNKAELETIRGEIEETTNEIQSKYYERMAQNAMQSQPWHLSIKDYERLYRVPGSTDRMKDGPKRDWCYSAYQESYWETAHGHCKHYAELNDAKAQYFLGSILEKGSGVEKDIKGAYVWYGIAALNNYDAAVPRREKLLATFTPKEIAELDGLTIRCLNTAFSECEG